MTLVTEEYPLTWFDFFVSRLSKYFHLKKKIDPNVSLVNLKHFLHHYKGAWEKLDLNFCTVKELGMTLTRKHTTNLSIAKDPSPSIVECHGFHPTFFVTIPKGLFVVSFKKSSTRSFYCLAMENKYNWAYKAT